MSDVHPSGPGAAGNAQPVPAYAEVCFRQRRALFVRRGDGPAVSSPSLAADAQFLRSGDSIGGVGLDGDGLAIGGFRLARGGGSVQHHCRNCNKNNATCECNNLQHQSAP